MTNKRLSLLLVTGVLTAALAGCSGDDAPGEAPSGSPSGSASVDPGNVSPTNLPDIPELKRNRGGAVKDLTLGECAYDPGKQEVSGTIESSQDKAVDYLVTVSWTTAGGDVMGRGFALLKDVQPGASEDFTIKAKVADGATQCVSGVVFGKA